jgi:cytochrome c553
VTGVLQATARWLLVLAAAHLPLPTVAQVAGRPLAEQIEACANCHGKDGHAEMPGVPSLAAQPALYLTNQLILFREGLRSSEAMSPFAKGLADPEIEALSAHYARQPRRPPAGGGTPDLMARGAALSQAMRCVVCHLPDYAGREQIARLAGQREDYLVLSMKSYRDNTRGAADTNMAAVLYQVPDADIAALAHYLARK